MCYAKFYCNSHEGRERVSCSDSGEQRPGSKTAPSTHSGPTGPPGQSAVQRRRLRTPVWARSISKCVFSTNYFLRCVLLSAVIEIFPFPHL